MLRSVSTSKVVASLVAAWPDRGANAGRPGGAAAARVRGAPGLRAGGGLPRATAMLPKLVACIESDNWRLVEKALSLWKNGACIPLHLPRHAAERLDFALERKKGGGASGGGVDLAAVVYPPMMAALLRGVSRIGTRR